MKYKILFKKKYKWESISKNSKIFYFKSSKEFVKKFLAKDFNFADTNNFELFLNNSGSFNNFIYEDSKYIICGVDKLNSDNIYFYKKDILYLSNDISEIIKYHNFKFKINSNSYNDTKLTGYVLGNKTIIEGINQLQAGQYLIYKKETNKFEIKNYFNFFSNKTDTCDRNEALKKLEKIEDIIFDELIERNKNKKILLALSGGLDSRYVLTTLLKKKFKNIILIVLFLKTLRKN